MEIMIEFAVPICMYHQTLRLMRWRGFLPNLWEFECGRNPDLTTFELEAFWRGVKPHKHIPGLSNGLLLSQRVVRSRKLVDASLLRALPKPLACFHHVYCHTFKLLDTAELIPTDPNHSFHKHTLLMRTYHITTKRRRVLTVLYE